MYRLLAAATNLRVGPALKWQLAHFCKVHQGDAALSEVEDALRQCYSPQGPIYVRHTMPFCGGDFSAR